MVTLNRIYTRTGDGGTTRLATGQTVSKSDLRVETYGAVDETNAGLGLAPLGVYRAHVVEALAGRPPDGPPGDGIDRNRLAAHVP